MREYEELEKQIADAKEDYNEGQFERLRDLLRHRKRGKRIQPRVVYKRLGGDRPGRNICVSGRITDDMDQKIDTLAEKENTTRSKIVADAVSKYVKERLHKDTTAFSNSKEANWDTTLEE